MSQVEATKVVAYVATGSTGAEAASSKVVAYMILTPGTIEAGDTSRQGHVHTQILRRG